MNIKLLLLATLSSFSCVVNAGELLVSAAASLQDAFSDLAKHFEQKYPDIQVKLNFAGSGSLLQQLSKGAPVDVLAVADQKTMDDAQKQNLIDSSTRYYFAQNDLVLITNVDSKLKLVNLKSLTDNSVSRIALSDPRSVPVGRYAKMALESDNLYEVLTPKYITTQHVRQSLDYVARDEVDAGFVYRTDAASRLDKVKVQFAVSLAQPISYPIAVTKDTISLTEAKLFVQYVLSTEGQAILSQYGFSQP